MKKIVSFVLAICLLLTAIVLPASALTAADFTDVPAGAWYYNAVNYCLENGLMSGMGKGVFSPNGTVTRSQITQVIYNREGSAPVDLSLNKFSDVGEKQWFARGVVWCNLNGIVSGNSSTTFNPNGQVTRGDLCLMLYNYVKKFKKMDCPQYTADEMDAKFVDWSVISWDKDALRWATRVGLVSGTGTDKATGKVILNPKGTANRAQLAQYLKNLNEKVFTEETPDPEKCPHGNDPDTCPICHPAKPTETPKPTPEPTPVPDKPMYTDDPAPETRLAGEQYEVWKDDAQAKVDIGMTDNITNDPAYNNPEYPLGENLIGGDCSRLVPAGGYVDGSSYVAGTIGWDDVIKASDDSTRIYNKYDIDVTDVDGMLSPWEMKFSKLLVGLRGTMAKDSPDGLKLIYDRFRPSSALQLIAETANKEATENLDNLTRAGLSLQVVKLDSTAGNCFELAVLNGSPEVSRKLLTLSRECTSRDDLISALCSEYGVSSWKDIPGLSETRARDMAYSDDCDWLGVPGGTYYFDSATIALDHTPDPAEAWEYFRDMPGTKNHTLVGNKYCNQTFGIALDEVNNTVTFVSLTDLLDNTSLEFVPMMQYDWDNCLYICAD